MPQLQRSWPHLPLQVDGRKDDRPCCDEVPGFFAKQVVGLACAALAIRVFTEQGGLSLALGPALEAKTFAADLPTDMRGLAIENAERSDALAFARPDRSGVMTGRLPKMTTCSTSSPTCRLRDAFMN